jgi:RNA polymerase sigma-70 factor (ECF subfamily)
MALAGSQTAFEEIVRRYERPIFNLICRIVRDPAVAEEIAQEAFLKTFRNLASYDSDRRFSSWIFRIAHNAALDALRRRKKTETFREDSGCEPAVPPPDPVESAALGQAISAALDQLRPEWRAVIVLRYQEGLSYEEIAEVVGMPEGTVKTFVHRARKQLMAVLTAGGWKP